MPPMLACKYQLVISSKSKPMLYAISKTNITLKKEKTQKETPKRAICQIAKNVETAKTNYTFTY